MFAPNFEAFHSLSGFLGVLSAAGGQMFFSLSLAMGITVTYGSYLGKKENLAKNSIIIIVADTIVAIMAGMAVLPASFALGGAGAEREGPKLLFVTLQNVFNSMGPAGSLFGVLFYLLVSLAAVTSTIALLEVLVSFLSDNAIDQGKKPSRQKLVNYVAVVVAVEAVIVALDGLGSHGLFGFIPFHWTGRPFGASWLDFLDFVSEGVAMPLGALLGSLLVGWQIGPKTIRDEVRLEGSQFPNWAYRFYRFSIRFLAPAVMAFILFGMVRSFWVIPG